MPDADPASFEEFWVFYLGEHSRARTRHMHFMGTTAVVVTAVVAAAARRPQWLAWTPLLGYGPAWIAHFCLEKNRPATFRYPLWSLVADFKLWTAMLRGELWCDELANRPD